MMCIDLLEKIKCGPDEFVVVKVDRQASPNRAREVSDAMRRLNLHGLIVRGSLEIDKMAREELRRLRDAANRLLGE